jgi:hypothetical protein
VAGLFPFLAGSCRLEPKTMRMASGVKPNLRVSLLCDGGVMDSWVLPPLKALRGAAGQVLHLGKAEARRLFLGPARGDRRICCDA